MKTRIVVTGIGLVSPYGIGPEILWDSLMAMRSGISAIACGASHVHCRVGGQWHDFVPEDHIHPRLARRIDRFSMFGLIAAQQALCDAGLRRETLGSPVSSAAPPYVQAAEGRDRIGITVGNNLGGWAFAERELQHLWQQGPRAVSPYMATAWFPAAVQGIVSIELGIKGIGRTFLCDRAGGAYALMHAAQCLQRSYADIMFAGGTEAPFSPYALLCYETSGLMSTHANEHPTTAYRPFDERHDGLVAAEGAAFLILERADDALRRGAHIYAELAGWAATHDGYDPIQPAPDGQQYAAAMTQAMRRAGVDGGKIDCLFAVGSAVPAEDISEARAIRLALGREAETVPVTAPKSAFGHLFGAATPVDVVMALLALHHHVIPPTLHLDRPARECALNNVAQHPRAADRLDVIAVNARGIGGANACLILKRWSPDVEGGRR